MSMTGARRPLLLASRTICRQVSVFTLFLSAIVFAFCIVGPSAIGSVKGIPSSITSAPPASMANITSTVSFSVGYPAVTYVTRAGRPSFLHRAKVDLIASILAVFPNDLNAGYAGVEQGNVNWYSENI